MFHEGVKVEIQGKEYIIPPLTLKSLKVLTPHIESLKNISDVPTETQIDAILEIAHAAMVRNYPDITKEHLFDLIDLSNMPQIFMAVMNSSGLEKVKPTGEMVSPQA